MQEAPDIDLHWDEAVLAEWRPQFRVFLRKLLIVGALTALGLGGLSFGLDSLITLLSFPLFMLIYIFLFDDYAEWPKRRDELWVLTNQRLLCSNPMGDEPLAWIHLEDIHRVGGWVPWALTVTLDNRQKVVVSFLADRLNVRDQIRSAVTQARGEAS